MSEKVKLLEMAANKASLDSNFIAFLIKKYMEFENISEQELLIQLHCTKEDYCKLNLCRVPDINANDFIIRLNNISQYTNASAFELNKIIKRTDSLLKLAGNEIEENHLLMAARDKNNKK